MKYLKNFILCAGLMLMTHAAWAGVFGVELLKNDITADQANRYVNVLNRAWILTTDSSQINISVRPKEAFTVTQLSRGSFEVRLVNAKALVNGLGLPLPLEVVESGASIDPEPVVVTTVAVEFKTPAGDPLDYDALQRDPLTRDLKLSALPNHANLVKIEGNRAIYQRNLGHGTTPIVVTLGFKYNGQQFNLNADLPLLDDGKKWKWVYEKKELFLDQYIDPLKVESIDEDDSAFYLTDKLMNRINGILKSSCQREAKEFKKRLFDSIKVDRFFEVFHPLYSSDIDNGVEHIQCRVSSRPRPSSPSYCKTVNGGYYGGDGKTRGCFVSYFELKLVQK